MAIELSDEDARALASEIEDLMYQWSPHESLPDYKCVICHRRPPTNQGDIVHSDSCMGEKWIKLLTPADKAEETPTAQSVLEAMVKASADLVKLPLEEQSRIIRIIQYGTGRMRPAPVGAGEDAETVVTWMMDPRTWERWSRW